jgi:putative membrane protein
MKRLTLDMLLAGTLAVAPLAWAQTDVPRSVQNPNDTNAPSRTGPAPTTNRRDTPAYPSGDPAAPERVPSDLPPAGVPAPSTTTGSERSGNEPVDATRTAGTADSTDGDLAILKKVHALNQSEIEMAQLAADKGHTTRVKSYARKLVTDHKEADRQVMSYASKKGFTSRLEQTATETPAATPGSDMHARLMGETGAEFDRDFVSTMVDDHDRAIETVKSARDTAVDPQLRSLLGDMLPKLEKHRKMAQDLLDKQSKS